MISAYEGEEIIEKIVIRGGEKHFERKYIPRTVFHDPKDKPAFILGNAPSRSNIDISKLKEHGFTYGCNANNLSMFCVITMSKSKNNKVPSPNPFAGSNIFVLYHQDFLSPCMPKSGSGITVISGSSPLAFSVKHINL